MKRVYITACIAFMRAKNDTDRENGIKKLKFVDKKMKNF